MEFLYSILMSYFTKKWLATNTLQICLKSRNNIVWPSICAVCGAKAELEAESSISVSDNFEYYGLLFKWNKKRLSISYPVWELRGRR